MTVAAALQFMRSFWYLFVIAGLVVALHFSNESRKDAVNALDLVNANNRAAVAENKAKNATDALADVKFHNEQERKFNETKSALLTSIDVVTGELHSANKKLASGAGKPQPIRVAANICDGAGAGGRLSSAIQEAFRDVDSITGRTAAGVIENQISIGASIVRPASVKQIEAAELREFAIRGNKVNAAPKP